MSIAETCQHNVLWILGAGRDDEGGLRLMVDVSWRSRGVPCG